jgi:hypothetical protein
VGDTGLGDWKWEAYLSGRFEDEHRLRGFAPLSNYARLMTAPNYGRGFEQRASVQNT